MRFVYDPSSANTAENGAVVYYTPGAFRSLSRIENCPCDDNKRRTVHITGEPDTAYTTPACTKANGKTVSGYISMDSGIADDSKAGPRFHATGKNRDVIAKARQLAKALTGD